MPVRRHPLYFEAEREDDLRRVGYSKERRVDPQIIVGLLVDRRGFPLQVGCWEGNKAETTTIIPVVEAFQAAHGIEDLIIVADAGMLSAANLTTLDDARLRFIVGARTTRAPGDLEAHFHWEGDAFTDGHHPQAGLKERAGQEPQGRAGVGPAHPPRLMEGHLGLLQEARRQGQPDPDRPGQPRPGHPSPARSAPRAHVLSPPTPVTPPWTRPPWPGPAPWWDSRATPPFVPSRLMGAGEVVSSNHELWHARAVLRR